MRSIFHNLDEIHWNVIDSIPIFDKEGKQTGCFGIIRNITPLIQAQELLKEETRRANDSTRLKSVFMANMTHEIRTPLNSIVGFSDLLPMIDSPEDKKEMIRVIMNNCDMLLRLINDILEISTMDGNAIVITPEEVDFARVFDDLCESLSQRVQNPAVAFIKENPYDTLTISVDQRRIQQVVTHFVTNAVKYTQQGHIRVGYKMLSEAPSAKELYIYCEDTGAGIPKEQQPSVFERFVKLNDYVQGTGLGLSICKAIADRYGGAIGVESEGLGHGSTFWLRIPIK
jgi:signal transduction histidine kinase